MNWSYTFGRRALSAAALLLLALLAASPSALHSQDAPRLWLPLLTTPPLPRILVAAAHIDSAISHEPDEALLLWNVGDVAQPLAGWSLTSGTRRTTFPITSTLTLGPGERLWCAAQAAAFATSFGAPAACEWAADSDPHAVDLHGAFGLVNGGGSVLLRNAHGELVDALLYGSATQPVDGWQGAPAQPYTRGLVGANGQVWQRKLDLVRGLPLDSDRAADWQGDLADLTLGRRVRYAGWLGWSDADLLRPVRGEASAAVTVAVGPEGLFRPLQAAFAAATVTIDLNIYTFEHPQLAETVAAAARRGVRVRVLLDGSPAGGVSDLERWCAAVMAAAGVDVRFMAVIDAAPTGYRKRYRFNHAKYAVIDGQRAFVGTDNFNWDSVPLPAAAAAGGRRGFYLFTDAAPVVDVLQRVFAADWGEGRFLDVRPFDPADPKYGAPPADFVLPQPPVYAVTTAPFAAPVSAAGAVRFVVGTAPENVLRADDGLHALIGRAGAGDELLVMQLYENRNWGESTSNPVADPNLRLEALLAAARRGAVVRILLDSYFDEPEELRSNRATVDYVAAVAAAEGLDVAARRANPTLGGIHAKLLLARVGGETWSAVGSLNGGEVSYKLNREVLLLVDMPAIHARLREVFLRDWALGSRE
jgi:cardiolipin synthase